MKSALHSFTALPSSGTRRFLATWLHAAQAGPVREEDALVRSLPPVEDRLVGFVLGVALLGAAIALIALLVVLINLSR